MQETVLETYIANNGTMAIFPSFQFDSYSHIIEKGGRHLYVKQFPLEIMKQSCLSDFASYEGRRQAAIQLTGIKIKVPIAVNPARDLYAFPTASPDKAHCHWLIYNHIRKIHTPKGDSRRTIVTFSDGTEALIPSSIHILEKQIYRTSRCVTTCQQMNN